MTKLKRIATGKYFPAWAASDGREWQGFIADISPEIEKLVQNRVGLNNYRPKLKSINLPTKKLQKIAC